MADPYIFWITEPSLLFYRLLFATACPKKFSDLYPERIVTGSDLIRTQIVIDGGNAAEKIVFLLKNEMYIYHFIHCQLFFCEYMQIINIYIISQ